MNTLPGRFVLRCLDHLSVLRRIDLYKVSVVIISIESSPGILIYDNAPCSPICRPRGFDRVLAIIPSGQSTLAILENGAVLFVREWTASFDTVKRVVYLSYAVFVFKRETSGSPVWDIALADF